MKSTWLAGPLLAVGCALAAPLNFQGVGGSSLTSYTAPDGAMFSLVDVNTPTGTGVFPAFLRIQANGAEQGYNTENHPPFVYDEKNGNTFNVPWPALGTWTAGSTDYYRFMLDWNESNAQTMDKLELLDLRLYAGLPDLDSEIGQLGFTSNTAELWTLAGSLNGSGYDKIVFRDSNAGQGRSDLDILAPKALIDPQLLANPGLPNMILYAKFGEADSSFEEFSYYAGSNPPISPVPEPSTMLLLGAGLAGLGLWRRFRARP